MEQVDTIKQLQRDGMTGTEISKRLSVDRKTVRKYLSRDDFETFPSDIQERPSKLDP